MGRKKGKVLRLQAKEQEHRIKRKILTYSKREVAVQLVEEQKKDSPQYDPS